MEMEKHNEVVRENAKRAEELLLDLIIAFHNNTKHIREKNDVDDIEWEGVFKDLNADVKDVVCFCLTGMDGGYINKIRAKSFFSRMVESSKLIRHFNWDVLHVLKTCSYVDLGMIVREIMYEVYFLFTLSVIYNRAQKGA